MAAFIDYATAAIHWVYRVLAEEERALVFWAYWGAGGGCAGCAYAPKAEVEFFCRYGGRSTLVGAGAVSELTATPTTCE